MKQKCEHEGTQVNIPKEFEANGVGTTKSNDVIIASLFVNLLLAKRKSRIDKRVHPRLSMHGISDT